MKITLEFNPFNKNDHKVIQSILQAAGSSVDVKTKEQAASSKPKKSKEELCKATEELNATLGEKEKLDVKERCRRAAKARWAKYKKEQEDSKDVKKKKKKRPSRSKKKSSLQEELISGLDEDSVQEPMDKYLQVPGGFVDEGKPKAQSVPKSDYIPDGREIIEGNYEGGDNWQGNITGDESDDFERKARELADTY